MKNAFYLLFALALLALPVQRAGAQVTPSGHTVTAAFTPAEPAGSVEYVLLEQIAGAFVLAPGSGPSQTSPIVFSGVAPGSHTYEAIARPVGSTAITQAAGASAPSNVVTVVIGPNAPTALSISFK